jgi:riboflavin kinase/FMN adenylyltransferase
MIRLDHRDPIPEGLRGGVLALGNFDGFHLGHQAVVREAVDWARVEGRRAIVATFDPHPVRHFAPHVPPFRLTTLDQRQELFAAAGADAMLVFHFDGDLASMTADSFVADLLCRHIGAAGVVTGEDFSFGAQRGGNVQVLREVGSANGMTARAVGPVKVDGQTVSSSRVRDLLKAGDCEGAAALLTRPFAIRGEVIHGDKRGRTIGYPTANLDMGTYLRPRYGIYAVSGRVVATGEPLQGAANLGIRPTFDPPKELLEPFLFDFAGDLYGQQIEVELRHFLRPEARFNDMPTLVAQMERDCLAAREALSAGPP